jgi:putative transposase
MLTPTVKREAVAEDQIRSHELLFRLYREERLGVRRRGGRKRALRERRPLR